MQRWEGGVVGCSKTRGRWSPPLLIATEGPGLWQAHTVHSLLEELDVVSGVEKRERRRGGNQRTQEWAGKWRWAWTKVVTGQLTVTLALAAPNIRLQTQSRMVALRVGGTPTFSP
jgi:hypothetical protein